LRGNLPAAVNSIVAKFLTIVDSIRSIVGKVGTTVLSSVLTVSTIVLTGILTVVAAVLPVFRTAWPFDSTRTVSRQL
jgi:hypothetical protein